MPPTKPLINRHTVEHQFKEIPSFSEETSTPFFELHTTTLSHLGAQVHWCQEPSRNTAVLPSQLAGELSSTRQRD